MMPDEDKVEIFPSPTVHKKVMGMGGSRNRIPNEPVVE
jgi:hypothetical protein